MIGDRIFYADFSCGGRIATFDALRADLAEARSFPREIASADPYRCFLDTILSLLADEPVRFSDPSGGALSGADRAEAKNAGFSSAEEMLRAVAAPKRRWRATLQTSGTAGRPKEAAHTFESLARSAKVSAAHSGDVWGFAYSPTHIAGLQVFLQALLNANPIIRLFGLPRAEIFRAIELGKPTHISATPTFYRNLAPSGGEKFPFVRRAIFGGERFDPRAAFAAAEIFPNARAKNVYASTEAGTVLSSDGEVFTVEGPSAERVKIENGELFLRGDALASAAPAPGEWFATGDCVETLSENPLSFKFSARRGDFINSGGYKINPLEVEDAIRRIDGVLDARVFARPSALLGSAVCAEVARAGQYPDEAQMRAILARELPKFKIPRVVEFRNSLAATPTGKLSRKI